MPFSFENFYHPAPAQVQRYCAAMQAVGGILVSSAFAAENKWLGWLGLTLCAVGVGLEKLWPQASLPDKAAEPAPADVIATTPTTTTLSTD